MKLLLVPHAAEHVFQELQQQMAGAADGCYAPELQWMQLVDHHHDEPAAEEAPLAAPVAVGVQQVVADAVEGNLLDLYLLLLWDMLFCCMLVLLMLSRLVYRSTRAGVGPRGAGRL